MIYFLIHFYYHSSLLTINVGNNEVQRGTDCHQVGHFQAA